MVLALYYITDLFNISNQLPSYVTKSSFKTKQNKTKQLKFQS